MSRRREGLLVDEGITGDVVADDDDMESIPRDDVDVEARPLPPLPFPPL